MTAQFSRLPPTSSSFPLWQRKTGASYAGFRLLLRDTCFMLFPRNVPRPGFLNLPFPRRKTYAFWFCFKETAMSRDRGVISQKSMMPPPTAQNWCWKVVVCCVKSRVAFFPSRRESSGPLDPHSVHRNTQSRQQGKKTDCRFFMATTREFSSIDTDFRYAYSGYWLLAPRQVCTNWL